MLILLVIIFLLLLFVTTLLDDFDTTMLLAGFSIVGIMVVIIVSIIMGVALANCRVIDEKITMYTEENTKIETQIDEIVTQYMEYETGTFKELKDNSGITLVSLYPELKSDALVSAQIETYQANNDKIKCLKEQKINSSIYKWWLYFGK